MTKKLPQHIKQQRKPISRACTFCHRKHLQCDSTRPCKNCVKRNVDKCEDVVRKKSKRKSRDEKRDISQELVQVNESISGTVSGGNVEIGIETGIKSKHPIMHGVDASTDTAADVPSVLGPATSGSNNGGSNNGGSVNGTISGSGSSNAEAHDTGHAVSDDFEANPPIINDFDNFNLFDEPLNFSLPAEMEFGNFFYDGLNNEVLHRPFMKLENREFNTSSTSNTSAATNPAPGANLGVGSKEWTSLNANTAHNEPGLEPEPEPEPEASRNYHSPVFIRKNVFQEVGDMYQKVPLFQKTKQFGEILAVLEYDSIESFRELIKYFYQRFYNKDQRSKKLFFNVLEKIWNLHSFYKIQDALIQTDLTHATNKNDSVLNEFIFHRQLLNFEKMITNFTSTPSIIWRNSTEIVFVSDELCLLIGIDNKSAFFKKRRFLCELIDDVSIVNYFQLFNGLISKNYDTNRFKTLKQNFNIDDDFEIHNNGTGVLSSGFMRFNCKFFDQRNHDNSVSCSSVLTIKKDLYDIPSLIVGQFLPILE